MNAAEAVTLVRLVKGICPAQQIDTYTPDAWALVLADIRYEDAQPAVIELAKRQPFISLSDIVGEVKRVRKLRIQASGVEISALGGGVDGDDVDAYLGKLRSDVKAIGDGASPAELEAANPRPVGALVRDLAERRAIESRVS